MLANGFLQELYALQKANANIVSTLKVKLAEFGDLERQSGEVERQCGQLKCELAATKVDLAKTTERLNKLKKEVRVTDRFLTLGTDHVLASSLICRLLSPSSTPTEMTFKRSTDKRRCVASAHSLPCTDFHL